MLNRGFIATGVTALCLIGLLPGNAASSLANPWYSATFARGETSNGYRWKMGVSGPKGKSLKTICNIAAVLDPPRDDLPYVESHESKVCSSLGNPRDSAALSISVGSGDSTVTVMEVLYRPVVRKVVLVLDNGDREIFMPAVARIRDRAKRGIPIFRYIIGRFDSETCLRKVITFDKDDHAVHREGRPPCSPGQGNI